MRLSRGSPAIWFATIARQTSANAIGTIGNPMARNAGRYRGERRSRIRPTANAPKKIHSVYTTRETMTP